jgi:hypothetical protein
VTPLKSGTCFELWYCKFCSDFFLDIYTSLKILEAEGLEARLHMERVLLLGRLQRGTPLLDVCLYVKYLVVRRIHMEELLHQVLRLQLAALRLTPDTKLLDILDGLLSLLLHKKMVAGVGRSFRVDIFLYLLCTILLLIGRDLISYFM